MKIHSLIAASILVALLASCSASNKADQTVDDVYYSPGRAVGADQADKNTRNDYAYNSEEDNYLRMMVQNRSRWGSIDDYAYWNSYNTSAYGLSFGYSNFYGNYWNNCYSYNYNPYSYNYNPYLSYGYSPYYNHGYTYGSNYYNPGVYLKSGRANTGSYVNLGAYQNHTFSNQNYSNGNHNSFSNGNTPQTGVGRLLRTIVTGSNTPNTYNPARTFSSPGTSTYSPSASPSSSSSAPAAASSRSSSTSGGGGRRN
jgi:hypothetical protein